MKNFIEFKDFFKKNIFLGLLLLVTFEGAFLFFFKDFPKTNVKIVGIGTLFVVVIYIMFMLSSIENMFYSLAFAFPLLPYSAYVFYSLEIKEQWTAHLALFIIFFISFIKNKGFRKLNINNELKKVNKTYFIILALILLSCITAYDKKNSFIIFIFGIFLPIVFFLMMYGIKIDEDRRKFIEKVFLCVCAGVVLSAAADVCVFVYATIKGLRLRHFTGPLGSNFIIAYSLLVYPFIIINYKRLDDIKLKNAYKILIVLETIALAVQMSRGLLIGLGFLFLVLLLSRKNLKYYIVLLLLIIIPVTYNASTRNDVRRDITNIEMENGIQIGEVEDFIEGQSMNRTVIWIPAINIIKDYPVVGVGMGNFKYFFLDYATKLKKHYIDAHNFVLTSASELGIIFTAVFIGLLILITIEALKAYKRTKQNKYVNMGFLAFLGAGFAYFSFANSTGAAFQCAGVIHSYTPSFLLIFIIFYYEYLMRLYRGNI